MSLGPDEPPGRPAAVIRVVEYDREWPRLFAEEATALRSVLGADVAARHVPPMLRQRAEAHQRR